MDFKLGRLKNRISGQSFHNNTITLTFCELCKIIGNPNGISGDNKSQYIWNLINEDETCEVQIYDWKWIDPIDSGTEVIWHIASNKTEYELALKEFLLNKIS